MLTPEEPYTLDPSPQVPPLQRAVDKVAEHTPAQARLLGEHLQRAIAESA